MSDEPEVICTAEWIDTIRTNYGLHDTTPGQAANWWYDRMQAAPVGAVAALGCAVDEIVRLRAKLTAAEHIKALEAMGARAVIYPFTEAGHSPTIALLLTPEMTT
jgi:hypothetical protein